MIIMFLNLSLIIGQFTPMSKLTSNNTKLVLLNVNLPYVVFGSDRENK